MQDQAQLQEFLELVGKESETFTEDDLTQALHLVSILAERSYRLLPSQLLLSAPGVAAYKIYFMFSPLHIAILNGHYELAKKIIEQYPEALNYPLSRIEPPPEIPADFSSAIMEQLKDVIAEAGRLTQGMFIAQRCHVDFRSLSYLKFALGSIGKLGIDEAAIDLITVILKTPLAQERLSEIADSNTLSSVFVFTKSPSTEPTTALYGRSAYVYKTLFLALLKTQNTDETFDQKTLIAITINILASLGDIYQGTFDISHFLSSRLKLNHEKTALIFDVTPELKQLTERKQASTAHQQVHGQPVASQQELLARELAEKIDARRKHAAGQEQASSIVPQDPEAASGSGIPPDLHEDRPSAPQNQPLLYGTPVAERTAFVEARIQRPAPPPPPPRKKPVEPVEEGETEVEEAATVPTKKERSAPPPVPPRRVPASPTATSATTFAASASAAESGANALSPKFP